MSYQIIMSSKADYDLSKIDSKNRSRIIKRIDYIKKEPFKYVKHLVGVPLFSLRVGDYRVLLDIKSSHMVILVVRIGHRSKVYDL